MADNLTWGAPPQAGHELLLEIDDDDDDSSPSPMETSSSSSNPTLPTQTRLSPSSTHETGMRDLVSRMSEQTLQQSRGHVRPPSPTRQLGGQTLEVDDEEMEDSPWPQAGWRPPIPNLPAHANRRWQRQLNVQLPTCPGHVRDRDTLVEDMIVSNSQCTLRTSAPPPHALPPPLRGRGEVEVRSAASNETIPTEDQILEVDEGYCEARNDGEDELEIVYRRASTPSGIRKYNHVWYGRCADIANIGGKVKVRNRPRMRKRKEKLSR